MDAFDDRRLLAYNTYEEYLDSFVQTDDIFYLRSRDFARIKAALGYRLVMVFVYLLNERCNVLHNMRHNMCSGQFSFLQ